MLHVTSQPATAPARVASTAHAGPRAELHYLQVLRALAALMVVFVHTGDLWPRIPYPTVLQHGYAGVDVFFCLSGFIIYYAHARDLGVRGAVRPFLFKRLTRIYPIYWIVTAVVLVAAPFVPRITDGEVPSLKHAVMSLLLLPEGRNPVVVPAWTLIHELRFYVMFALAMHLPRRGFLAVMSAIGLASVAMLNIDALAPAVTATRLARVSMLVIHPATAEFVLGIMAGEIFLNRATPAWFDRLVLVAGAVLMLGALQFHDAIVGTAIRYHAVAAFAIPAFLLVLGIVLNERRRGLGRAPRPLVFLGDASYSLYLVHGPLLRVVGPLLVAAFVTQPWVVLLLAALLSIAVGVGTYVLVERPILRAARRIITRKAPSPAGERSRPSVPVPTNP